MLVKLPKSGGDVLVYVQEGLAEQIQILSGHTLWTQKKKLHAGDAAFTKDSDEVVLAIAQGGTNNPTEIFTTTACGGAIVQLSDHGRAFADEIFGTASFLSCRSSHSEVTLETFYLTPASASQDNDGKPEKPLPTAVMIHGGPYSRHREAFDSMYFIWFHFSSALNTAS